MEEAGYLYILESQSTGQYYIGSALDPDRRLQQHNANANKSTRNKGPWSRIALLQFVDVRSAKKAELWLKRMKSRRITELVSAGEFQWKKEFQLMAVLHPPNR